MKPYKVSYRSNRPCMSFPFFPLCTFITLLPLVLSLNGLRAPEALQSTSISLRGMGQENFDSDCLGAFLTNMLQGSVKVTTKNRTTDNFAADRSIDITFNLTSPSGKDCNLLAWLLPEPCPCSDKVEHPNGDDKHTTSKSNSESGASRTTTPAVMTSSSGPGATSTFVMMGMMPIESTIPSSLPSETTSPGQSTTKAIPTEAIVAIAVGAFAFLLSVSLAFFVWRRRSRQKAKESAPSRIFWRSLDKKSSPVA
ncbi:hypothetical protein EDD18DRAFT_1421003 [Armillaria luteobubalina]|uniref:Uncharacterized protein n=1 Tax=Armillaria luteobubalina TaxID=153913 RepID=A0AA39QI70_9AGAR|nr:hypothetical protein EDD18DRAFT_1421003 [Armillaria luteobubalina]